MVSPLEGSIAKTVNAAFGSVFYECTITRSVTVGGDEYDPSTGTTTPTNYLCKGMVDEYSDYERQNSLIEAGDRKIIILTNSLSILPKVSDTVTIRNATYNIIRIKADPALATWTIQGRV